MIAGWFGGYAPSPNVSGAPAYRFRPQFWNQQDNAHDMCGSDIHDWETQWSTV